MTATLGGEAGRALAKAADDRAATGVTAGGWFLAEDCNGDVVLVRLQPRPDWPS